MYFSTLSIRVRQRIQKDEDRQYKEVVFMEKSKKRIVALFLSFCMVVSLAFPRVVWCSEVNDEINNQTVVVLVEKFVLGEGYILEPVEVPYFEGMTAADAIGKATTGGAIHITGLESGYISAVADIQENASNNIPEFIKEGCSLNDEDISGRASNQVLQEYDYTYYSGWMYTINQVMPNVGVADQVLNANDVVRLQFSLYWGYDLGIKESWCSSFYTESNKNQLFRALAHINSTQALKNDPIIRSEYDEGLALASNLQASSQEVMEQVSKLNESMEAIDVTIKTPQKTTLLEGESIQFTIDAPEDASLATKWQVVNGTGKGSIDENGLFSAKESGTVTIQLYCSSLDQIIDEVVLTIKKASTPEIYGEMLSSVIQYIGNETDFTVAYDQQNNDWNALVLGRNGNTVPSAYGESILKFVKSQSDEAALKEALGYPTSIERMVLGLTASGYDATSVAGYNLIKAIYTSDLDAQGINALAYALLAYDCAPYEVPQEAGVNTREQIIGRILEQELDDGGWGYSAIWGSDVDLTAMVIQALAPYYTAQTNVQEAVDKGLHYLSTQQDENGGYIAWGSDTCESTAQVICALTSLGIDPAEEADFIKANGNLLSHLGEFYDKESGAFKHDSSNGINTMATQQAAYALLSYDRFLANKNSLYNMSDVLSIYGLEKLRILGEDNNGLDSSDTGNNGNSGQGSGSTVSSIGSIRIAIERSTLGLGDLYNGTIEIENGDTPYSILKKAGLDVRSTGSGSNIYVQSINGLSEFDHGATSGWMYSVNGTFPNVSASAYILKNGDIVKWQYTVNLGKDLGASSTLSGGAGTGSESISTVKETISSIKSAYEKLDTLSQWELLSYIRNGGTAKEAYQKALVEEIKANQGHYRKSTDLEKMVLVLTSMGMDCTNIEGYNLIEAIYNHENLMLQGNNGAIFALIAIDSHQYKVPAEAVWTRDKLKETLISGQNNDGGFALNKGEESDVDITAMTLQALAPYKNESSVKKSIDKGLAYLASVQKANGQFASYNTENSESLSQVIIALTSLEINPATYSNLIKQDKNLIELLLEYKVNDSHFSHVKGGEANSIATEQAFMALESYRRYVAGEKSLYNMMDVVLAASESKEIEQATVSVDLNKFKDASKISAWATEELQEAVNEGIISGYGDTLEPQKEVTRAEFIVMLMRTLDLDSDGAQEEEESESIENLFNDMNSSDWYAEEVKMAYQRKFINGMGEKSFKPNENMNREQMAAILAKLVTDSNTNDAAFKDSQSISSWAGQSVNVVYNAGILKGYLDGSFKPKASVTREMAAITLLRIQKSLGSKNI